MSKKIGVLLSGCGVFDGSEIHEAVLVTTCNRVDLVVTTPDEDPPVAEIADEISQELDQPVTVDVQVVEAERNGTRGPQIAVCSPIRGDRRRPPPQCFVGASLSGP